MLINDEKMKELAEVFKQIRDKYCASDDAAAMLTVAYFNILTAAPPGGANKQKVRKVEDIIP